MTSTILVITGERNWTRRAMHLAGAMAREADAAIAIVRMVRVGHLEYLGAGAREELLSYDEFDALSEYVAIAEAYGVTVNVELFEYSDYSGGVVCAAEWKSAVAVIAPVPTGFVAPVAWLRLWMLRRSLRQPLYTLDEGDGLLVWTEAQAEEPAAPAVHLRHM